MFLQSLVSPFGAKSFFNKAFNCSLAVGLVILVIYFFVQVKPNTKETFLSAFLFQPDSNEINVQKSNVEENVYSAVETAYRKKFNLMERPEEVTGEECNLGSFLVLFSSFS